MSNRYTLFITAFALAGTAMGQTQVDLRTQSKSVDFSAASSTKPFETGVALPPVCSIGQMFFLTNAPGGTNTYGCSAANTWTQQIAGIQSTTIKSSGTLVGSRPVVDISTGIGGLLATSDNGQELLVQASIDTSVIETRADHQAGAALFCGSTSSGAPGVAYVCAMTPTLTAYTTGMVLNWKPDVNGVGGTTNLNVDILGAISIVKADGVSTPGGSDIVAGQLYQLWYDGAVFRLVSSIAGSGGGSSSSPGTLPANAEYTTSRVMNASYCPGWLGTFTGSSALTFTLAAPIAGCLIGIQNNTSQPMTINITTNGVALNGQTANGTIPACLTPANGCKVVTIKANSTSSWDMSAPGADGATGSPGAGGTRNIGVIFSGAETVAGTAVNIPSIDFSCTLSKATLSADAGTATIKLWKVAAGGTTIPTSGNSMSTSGFSLASGTKVTVTNLADLNTTGVTAGDSLTFNLFAVTGSPTHIAISMECDQ